MEKVILDPAIKFGAGRYRQEEHLLEECGKEIARFGKKLYIIAGKRAWEAVRERLVPGIEEEKLEYVLDIYREPALMKQQKNMQTNVFRQDVMKLLASAVVSLWILQKQLASMPDVE